jgi:methionyl-tRNA synthetase
MKTFYITTPIYYVNDVPHVGHAYTTIAADVLTRALRLQGHTAFFLTGTDEHGQNISQAAQKHGMAEQPYTDSVAAKFRELWERLGIRYDDFIRTTEDRHIKGVLRFWGRLKEATGRDGQPAIYRGKYSGWYCPRCEAFKLEDDVVQPGNLCTVHKLPCEWTEEENLFFRLSAYADWLKDEITSGRLRIEPETRRNEILAVIRQGLQDFSVTRAHVKWGIPVPGDEGHVFYVWVDALSNYITALGYGDDKPAYKKFWEGADERFHLMGKEIIRFHCLYWPAMLQAAGLPVPNRVFAHGWLTKDGAKISKTTGNVIDTDALIRQYGVDPVRYFFLREGSFGQDWDFTEAAFIGRYNSDLANDLGNLASRVLTMVSNYCTGKVPPRVQRQRGALDQALSEHVLKQYENVDFTGALNEVWRVIGGENQEIVKFEPWVAAKDPSRRQELEAFLYHRLEFLRQIAVLVSPVMPTATERIFKMMGLEPHPLGPDDLKWGVLEPGRPLGTIEPLFPRMLTSEAGFTPAERAGGLGGATLAPPGSTKKKEKKVSDTPIPPAAPAASAAPAADGLIDISEFAKVELKVAKIVAAEKVEGAKKLLKLQIDLGTETRQIVSGIAEAYTPESLVGKTIAVVANLKPAKIRGVESNGMLLAASAGDKPVLCIFDADVPPGTRIK